MANLTQAQVQVIITLYNSGKMHEAIDAIKALSKDHPNVPLLFNIMGACYKALSQLNAAVEMFEKAIKIKPDYAEAHYNFGVTLHELGQFDSAIIAYKKAIILVPNYPDAHNNLGIIYLDKSQLNNAIDHFEWAIAYKHDFAEAHNNLGSSFQKKGKIDNAITSYKKAIAINSSYAQAHNNIGILFQKLGKLEFARKSYKKAIACKPEYASAHHNLSALKKYSNNDEQITQMMSLVSDDNLSKSSKIYLCFALAKANEDLGKKDELFKYLNEGNRLRKEELKFSFDDSKNHNSITKKLFSSPVNITAKSSGRRPIFIVGMPRSGTSLVEQIISNHHQVYGAGELKSLTRIIAPILQGISSSKKIEISKENIFLIRQQYLDSLSSLDSNENIITDKWPLNFRNIGFILSAFPEAKIVHLKRDARAVCWSIYKHYFSEIGNGWAYNLNDIVRFYKLYEDLMVFWHHLYPNKIYDIFYEDLTTNQEEQTRLLLEYCEVEWDENCLNFQTNNRTVNTASSLQVRQKMYQGSSEVWLKYKEYLQPLFKGLD